MTIKSPRGITTKSVPTKFSIVSQINSMEKANPTTLVCNNRDYGYAVIDIDNPLPRDVYHNLSRLLIAEEQDICDSRVCGDGKLSASFVAATRGGLLFKLTSIYGPIQGLHYPRIGEPTSFSVIGNGIEFHGGNVKRVPSSTQLPFSIRQTVEENRLELINFDNPLPPRNVVVFGIDHVHGEAHYCGTSHDAIFDSCVAAALKRFKNTEDYTRSNMLLPKETLNEYQEKIDTILESMKMYLTDVNSSRTYGFGNDISTDSIIYDLSTAANDAHYVGSKLQKLTFELLVPDTYEFSIYRNRKVHIILAGTHLITSLIEVSDKVTSPFIKVNGTMFDLGVKMESLENEATEIDCGYRIGKCLIGFHSHGLRSVAQTQCITYQNSIRGEISPEAALELEKGARRCEKLNAELIHSNDEITLLRSKLKAATHSKVVEKEHVVLEQTKVKAKSTEQEADAKAEQSKEKTAQEKNKTASSESSAAASNTADTLKVVGATVAAIGVFVVAAIKLTSASSGVSPILSLASGVIDWLTVDGVTAVTGLCGSVMGGIVSAASSVISTSVGIVSSGISAVGGMISGGVSAIGGAISSLFSW